MFQERAPLEGSSAFGEPFGSRPRGEDDGGQHVLPQRSPFGEWAKRALRISTFLCAAVAEFRRTATSSAAMLTAISSGGARQSPAPSARTRGGGRELFRLRSRRSPAPCTTDQNFAFASHHATLRASVSRTATRARAWSSFARGDDDQVARSMGVFLRTLLRSSCKSLGPSETALCLRNSRGRPPTPTPKPAALAAFAIRRSKLRQPAAYSVGRTKVCVHLDFQAGRYVGGLSTAVAKAASAAGFAVGV